MKEIIVNFNRSENISLSLHAPGTQARGAIEQCLTGLIEVTDEPVDISMCDLDFKGRKRFLSQSTSAEIETVIGFARLKWKSTMYRKLCIKIQTAKNKKRPMGESRWTEITSMAYSIGHGIQLPLPALLHPALHSNDGLVIIDGARRVIAHIEASVSEFSVVVIRPRSSEGVGGK